MDEKLDDAIAALDRLGDQLDVFNGSWYRETTDNMDISLFKINENLERIANALETIASK